MDFSRLITPIANALGFTHPGMDSAMDEFYSGGDMRCEQCGQYPESDWTDILLPFLIGIAVCTWLHPLPI